MKNVVLNHKPSPEILIDQLSPGSLIGIDMGGYQKAFVQRDVWEGQTFTIICKRGFTNRNNYISGATWSKIVETLTYYIKPNGYSVLVFDNESEMFTWLAAK